MDWRAEVGRLFPSLDPVTENARLPTLDFFVFLQSLLARMIGVLLELEAEHGVIMDDEYDGVVPDWIWYVKREILNAIGARTGSQCSSLV